MPDDRVGRQLQRDERAGRLLVGERVDVGAEVGGTEGQDLGEAVDLLEQGSGAVGEERVDDQRLDAGVGEHVGVVVDGAERVQRRTAQAEQLAGADADEHLGPVEGEQPHRRAAADPDLAERLDEAAHAVGQVLPGPRVAVDVQHRLVPVAAQRVDEQVAVVRSGAEVGAVGPVELVELPELRTGRGRGRGQASGQTRTCSRNRQRSPAVSRRVSVRSREEALARAQGMAAARAASRGVGPADRCWTRLRRGCAVPPAPRVHAVDRARCIDARLAFAGGGPRSRPPGSATRFAPATRSQTRRRRRLIAAERSGRGSRGDRPAWAGSSTSSRPGDGDPTLAGGRSSARLAEGASVLIAPRETAGRTTTGVGAASDAHGCTRASCVPASTDALAGRSSPTP